MPMRSQRRPSRHKPHAPRDQRNPQPAQRADLFMQHESRNQRQQHIAQGSRRQNIGEVRPGERSRIRSEEGQQQNDPHRHPRIQHRQNQPQRMLQRDRARLLHPVRKHGVPGRGKQRDPGQHKIFA